MSQFMFSTILTPAQYTSDQELVLALGLTTLVNMTTNSTRTFFGIQAIGGNVDGMVVMLSNLNNSSFQIQMAHESGSASAAANRCRNLGLSTASGGTGAGGLMYRYNAAVGRWVHIAST